MRFILDVGAEFADQSTASRTSALPWSDYIDSDGYFSIPVRDEDVETILGERRHRELVFKVYSGGEIIGSQTVHVSRATLRGTELVTLTADPSTVPTDGDLRFAVSGFLVETDGTPLASMPVALVEKKLRSTSPLGSATTDSQGRFLIRYNADNSGPDVAGLTVALSASSVGASAQVFCNPPLEFTARLVRGGETYRGRSEFELDVATLGPLLDTATLDELSADDVRFLRCQTEQDTTALATLVRAHALADRYSLPASAFVAFARAGIPLSTLAITALRADEIDGAIEEAVAANAVPATLSAQIPAVVTALAAARVDRIVPSSNPTTTPLGAILVAAGLPFGMPRRFAEEYAAHTGSAEQFWAHLRASNDFGDAVVDRIQFALQTGAISGGHAPFVKLLDQKRVFRPDLGADSGLTWAAIPA